MDDVDLKVAKWLITKNPTTRYSWDNHYGTGHGPKVETVTDIDFGTGQGGYCETCSYEYPIISFNADCECGKNIDWEVDVNYISFPRILKEILDGNY